MNEIVIIQDYKFNTIKILLNKVEIWSTLIGPESKAYVQGFLLGAKKLLTYHSVKYKYENEEKSEQLGEGVRTRLFNY